jgi:transposase
MKIDNTQQENTINNTSINDSSLLMEPVFVDDIQSLKKENSDLKNKLSSIESYCKKLESQLNWFQEQVKLAKIKQFGKSSESVNTLQLPLFDEEYQEETPEVEEDKETITYQRRRKTVGRLIDTSKLPREIQRHDLPDHEKICACGNHLIQIGEDKSEQLDYIPAQLKVIEHIHPKYACRTCDTVKSAEKPITSPLPKSMASAGFITEVILDKYEYHLPLYRQSQRFKNHGLIIPDNTLGNWVMNSAELLQPLREAFWFEVKNTAYLQVDETTVKILDPDKKGYMWVYHSAEHDNRFVMFEFHLSRSSDVPEYRLRDFKGKCQTDGYSGYHGIR